MKDIKQSAGAGELLNLLNADPVAAFTTTSDTPKKPKNETARELKSKHLTLAIRPSLEKMAREDAAAAGMSLNAYIAKLLEDNHKKKSRQ